MAFAMGKDLPISTKKSVEICKAVRSKTLIQAKRILEDAISLKRAIPYTRFNDDTAHKPGMGPGKYPIKTAKFILSVVESAENNAQAKGLNTSELIVHHICVHKASTPSKYGRRRRKTKRSHIEVVLLEQKKKESK